MKAILVVLLLVLTAGCGRQSQPTPAGLYQKWQLMGGSLLDQWRATAGNKPFFITFFADGQLDWNGSNCDSFRVGTANELLVTNNCVDCAAIGCGQTTWHYAFSTPGLLVLTFPGGKQGVFTAQ